VNAPELLVCRCSRRSFLLLGAALLVACRTETSATSTTEPTLAGTAESTSPPQPSPTPAPTATAEPQTIEVRGSGEFRAWTEQALELLKTRAPDHYQEVIASIRVIESIESGSGMYVQEKRYVVGQVTAYAPGYTPERQLLWYAGTIVHDAHHSALFSRGEPHSGKQAEIACLRVQKAALEKMDSGQAGRFFADYVQGLIDGADDPANQYWNQPNRHW
jgi:hypothetical protein